MSEKMKSLLQFLHHYIIYFLLLAFVISCCTILFVETMTETMGLTLTGDNIGNAAKLTFANVVFLSLLITTIDRKSVV